MIRVQVYFPKSVKVVMERLVNVAPDAFPFSDTERVLRLLYHPDVVIKFSVDNEQFGNQ